ncbi:MAG: PhoX family phosphatase [Pseudomonadota bacterium]
MTEKDTIFMQNEIVDIEDIAVNPRAQNSYTVTLSDIIERNFSRRVVMGGMGAAAMSVLIGGCDGAEKNASEMPVKSFDFEEIPHGVDENIHFPKGYEADILIRWGDPLHADAPNFDPYAQSASKQARQFGFNNDYIGLAPLPMGSENASSGLLCVNHEYAITHMMFPDDGSLSGKDKSDIEQAALGNSIVEVKRDKNQKWHVVQDSPFNRRITMLETPITVDGPAAGHQRLQTPQDKTGRNITGTFQNCAGGMTPWGTYLTCEENINHAFGNINHADQNNPEIQKAKRFGVGKYSNNWYKYDPRFDLKATPNEINRFGWVVEIDPYDPTSQPVKHTALGRCKHEGCSVTIDKSGYAVAYMGDDQHFEYLYKFVSKAKYDPKNRKANLSLLSEGTLFAAQFNEDGKMNWLELTFGKNGLTPENGFASQADVMIDARIAGDIVGATPLDRPEDVEIHPENGRIYVSLTKNEKRKEGNIANPRTDNIFGHILEISTQNDHLAQSATWDILLFGDKTGSYKGRLACPDNLAFDGQARLWASTDQGSAWSKTGNSDGLYAVTTEGKERGYAKLFFRSPVGAETTGLCFTKDSKTLFISVQHPSADDTDKWDGFGRKSTFSDPATRWPDFQANMPPRPSVVQITRKGKMI